MSDPKNPFSISIPFNEKMDCFEMHCMVGNLSKHEAQLLADALSDWLIEGSEHGWKARVS